MAEGLRFYYTRAASCFFPAAVWRRPDTRFRYLHLHYVRPEADSHLCRHPLLRGLWPLCCLPDTAGHSSLHPLPYRDDHFGITVPALIFFKYLCSLKGLKICLENDKCTWGVAHGCGLLKHSLLGRVSPSSQPFPSLSGRNKAGLFFFFLCPSSVSGSECDWKCNGAGRGNPSIEQHGLERGNI